MKHYYILLEKTGWGGLYLLDKNSNTTHTPYNQVQVTTFLLNNSNMEVM